MVFSETDFFFKMREGAWRNFYDYPEVDSTNSVAEYFIGKGVSSGIVMADLQTAGRGRRDHVWNSQTSGNVYISFFGKCEAIETLPLSIALAVKMTADSFASSSDSFLKWPNDLIVNGGKCSGFLGKTLEHNRSLFYIAGIGFNILAPNIDVFPLKPSGLQEIVSQQLNKMDVAVKLKENFEQALNMEKELILDKVKDSFAWMIERKAKVSIDGNSWKDSIIKGFSDDFSSVIVEIDGTLLKTAAISIGEII